MRVLLRTITRRGKGGATHSDATLQRARITLGRGTDQDVLLANLRVALAHAEIVEGSDRKLRINALASAGIRHNGQHTQTAVLALNDVIEIGSFDLRVKKGDGHDFMLEVEERPATRGKEMEEALLARSRLTIESTGLRKRPVAWALFLVTFIGLLLVPMAGSLVAPVGEVLRAVPGAPSDHAWLSGPTSHSHSGVVDDCQACHATPFVPTSNEACLGCHKGTPHHVELAVVEAGGYSETRCAGCHHEHTGTRSVVNEDGTLCSDCHANLGAEYADTKLENAWDFARGHPQFRPTLHREENGRPTTVRVSMDDREALVETSNLEFPHKDHVAEKGILGPEGKLVQLGCADCHQQEPGGGLMKPVDFETHCESCHRLTIVGDEKREVPHGDLDAALATIRDYYSGWALRGGYPNLWAPEVVQTRRRPGHELAEAERSEALEWARRTAETATGEMLGYTTCGVCHRAEQVTDSAGSVTWRMPQVQVTQVWLPKSEFSHAGHSTEPCKACHVVEQSEDSADVLLVGENGKVGIEACRDCHSGEHPQAGRVTSTCISCHGFHVSKTASLER